MLLARCLRSWFPVGNRLDDSSIAFTSGVGLRIKARGNYNPFWWNDRRDSSLSSCLLRWVNRTICHWNIPTLMTKWLRLYVWRARGQYHRVECMLKPRHFKLKSARHVTSKIDLAEFVVQKSNFSNIRPNFRICYHPGGFLDGPAEILTPMTQILKGHCIETFVQSKFSSFNDYPVSSAVAYSKRILEDRCSLFDSIRKNHPICIGI